MVKRIRDLEHVLADTSVFCNVLRALPETELISLLDYLDDRLGIVTDVQREMNGLTRGPFPGLDLLKSAPMIGEFLRAPSLALDPDQVADVGAIVNHSGIFTPDPANPRKNWGEVATVLAASRRNAPVLMDDRDGLTFARRRGVTAFGTWAVAAQMCVDGIWTPDEAFAVWRASGSSANAREHFERAVKAAPT